MTITPPAAPSSVTDQASTGVGSGPGQQVHAHTGGGDHAGGVEGEDVALAPGVEADGDATRRGIRIDLQQVLDEPARRLADDEAVHAQRSGPDGGTQPGGAEHQPATEPGGQLVGGPAEQGGELVADVVVGFGVEPAPGGGADVVDRHGKSVRSSTRGRGPTWLITSAAAIEPSRPHSSSGWPRV